MIARHAPRAMYDRPWRLLAVILAAVVAGWAQFAAAQPSTRVVQEEVTIITPDGRAEALVSYPAGTGTWPAVILWPDFVGTRPAFRDLARRYAAQGFVVLLPNAFYRSMRPSDAELNPRDPAVRPSLMEYRAQLTAEATARDAAAYLSFLDGLAQTRRGKIGTIGYDLGAVYAMYTAASQPERTAAVGLVYALGTINERPDSPHLLAARTRAAYHFAIARDDNTREPEDVPAVRDTLAKAGLEGTVELVDADHGFANPAVAVYDASAAQRVFDTIVALLHARLD